MSLHATYFAAAGLPGLLRAQGKPIELIAKGDKRGETMTALCGSEESHVSNDRRGRTSTRRPKFTITKDPSGEFGGAEDPQENGTILYAGVEYAVQSRQDVGEGWELVCVSVGRTERSRAGLRLAG